MRKHVWVTRGEKGALANVGYCVVVICEDTGMGVTQRNLQEERVARDLLLDLLTVSLGDSSRLSLRLLERKKPD